MADPLSVTAGIVGLLAFAGSTLTKGYGVLRFLKESSKDVNLLLVGLSQLTGILVAVEAQEKGLKSRAHSDDEEASPKSQIFESSVSSCRKSVEKVWGILHKLEKSRRAVLAIKWQFLEPEVKKSIQEVEHYKTIFVLCLGVDTRRKTDDVIELQKQLARQLGELKDEQSKEVIAANVERARSKRRALMQWLAPKNDEAHIKIRNTWTPGTGNWLIDHADFLSWMEGPDSLLWLNGIPGSGKTVLMSCVVEKLKARLGSPTKLTGLAYFYCTYKESEDYPLTFILTSLLAQLIRCFPEPETGPAMRLFEKYDDGTLAAKADDLKDTLIQLIHSLDIVFLCLDAVDECSPTAKDELLRLVFSLAGGCHNLKIIVSSRSGDSEVFEAFDGYHSITITPHAVASDIDLYIKNRINRGPKRLKLAQSDHMISKLIVSAEGMFLWISCQMDQLSRLGTTASVYAALGSLPKGLPETYRRILDGITPENATFASRALRWLAHAAAPLSLVELVEAIAVDETSSSLDDLQKLTVPEDLFQICGSLIRQSETTGTLSLAHTSVFEYLTGVGAQSSPLSFNFPVGSSEILLAKACLTYLSFKDFDKAHMLAILSPQLDDDAAAALSEFEWLTNSPFFDYTLRNWWKHLPSSQEALDELWPHLIRFFDSEAGNFVSLIMLLHRIESTYRYPMGMQPIHFCATHGLHLVSWQLLESSIADVDCKAEDGRRALHMAAENGHELMVQYLMLYNADASAQSADGRTPLQLAMESGNDFIAQFLVQNGADVNANFASGETPLSVSVANRLTSLVEILLSEKADANGRLHDGRAPLHIAAEVGSDSSIIELLRIHGANPSLGDDRSWTALHYAAHYGHRDVTSILIDDESAPDMFVRHGWTPLHAAVEQERTEIVRLFARFAGPSSEFLSLSSLDRRERRQPTSRRSPLSSSGKAVGTARDARRSYNDIEGSSDEAEEPTTSASSARQPLRSDASVKGRRTQTPLFLATSQGYLEGVEILVRAGLDLEDVKNCIRLALAGNNVALLDKLTLESEEHMKVLLSFASTQGNKKKSASTSDEALVFSQSLFNSFPWNATNIPIAMKILIEKNNLALLHTLIEQTFLLDNQSRRAIVEQLSDSQRVAIQFGDVEAVRLLRTAKTDLSKSLPVELRPHTLSDLDATLLHHATKLQNLQMVSYLLVSIDANAKDHSNRTALHYAVKHRKAKDLIFTLCSFGSDVSSQDEKGCTPLHLASHHGRDESVSCLLEAGAAINVCDNAGRTPLHHCAFSSRVVREHSRSAMALLIEKGASLSALDHDGLTPFQLVLSKAIRSSSSGQLADVLEQQAGLVSTKLPPLERTPLHLAAELNCDSSILNELFWRKANLEAEDRDGKTPVQIAGTDTGAHRWLVNHGAQWKE